MHSNLYRGPEGNVAVMPAAAASSPTESTKADAVSIGFWKIALAVLAGNLMTGIVGALLYLASH